MRKNETVILLHGLARSHGSMRKLEVALQKAGYSTININYPSTGADIDTLSSQTLTKALNRCLSSDKVHFVTHSLGGILLRYYLQRHSIPKLGRVVMLAPPNQGSDIARWLSPYRLFTKLLGPAAAELSSDSSSTVSRLGPANFELGIIAGTRPFNPLFTLCLDKPNDGTITISDSKLSGMTDHISLPATHSFIMRNKQVISQTRYFLEKGRFKR